VNGGDVWRRESFLAVATDLLDMRGVDPDRLELPTFAL
jgi:hypothetical protein